MDFDKKRSASNHCKFLIPKKSVNCQQPAEFLSVKMGKTQHLNHMQPNFRLDMTTPSSAVWQGDVRTTLRLKISVSLFI